MKNLISIFSILTTSTLLATSAFADVSISATAKWDAKAVKDTSTVLVVTPIKSLNFKYAEGVNQFNNQTGAFDVTILGQTGATDFELTSKIANSTLTRVDNASTLEVGVEWLGKKLTKTGEVTLIDTATNINAGLETLSLAGNYAGTTRKSAKSNFIFTIDGATSDGTTSAQFEDLIDGMWNGEVAVQFTANWVGP